MVTENMAEAVTTPPEASPPLTQFSAVLSKPVVPELFATRSLFDQLGGELVSTVRATASFCFSLASAGATATTRPENPADVASASVVSRPLIDILTAHWLDYAEGLSLLVFGGGASDIYPLVKARFPRSRWGQSAGVPSHFIPVMGMLTYFVNRNGLSLDDD